MVSRYGEFFEFLSLNILKPIFHLLLMDSEVEDLGTAQPLSLWLLRLSGTCLSLQTFVKLSGLRCLGSQQLLSSEAHL